MTENSENQAPDFIAIDFETATARISSACAVGIVAVSGVHIVDQFYSLIQPPQNVYDAHNIEIHGITPKQTENAPAFADLLPEISRFFDPHVPVVAHNPQFDMSVLRMASDAAEFPDFVYVNSMDIARYFVSGSLSLDNCAKEMGINLEGFTHHDALADAAMCANITVLGIRALGCETLWELLAKQPIDRRVYSELKPIRAIGGSWKIPSTASFRVSDLQPCADGAEGGPLCGKTIVFTGEMRMERKEAAQLAVNAGAVVRSSVSKLTNILVVGRQDMALVGDDGMSAKEEKAYALNESGAAQIRIIGEDEFLAIVGVSAAAP